MAALIGAVAGARSLLLGDDAPTIDNWTFRLFYQYSTSLLLASSLLVTSNQFFGEPINCDLPSGGVSDDTLKAYCWMYSNFNVPLSFQGHCARKGIEIDEEFIQNSYYQWVSLCLVGQACLFYIPRAIWLSLEGGLMKHLAKDKQGMVIENGEEKCDSLICNYTEHLRNKYDRYFAAFLACEAFNVFVVICQIFLTNAFLKNEFLTYGSDVYRYYDTPQQERSLTGDSNPMCQVFPKVASCTYFRYGMGGRQEALQAICVLALNIVIDKIFLVLWFWYVLLLIFGIVRLVQRLLQGLRFVRFFLMKMRMHRYFRDTECTDNIKCYMEKCSIGDWFVLYQMSKNINRKLFYMFLIRLSSLPDDVVFVKKAKKKKKDTDEKKDKKEKKCCKKDDDEKKEEKKEEKSKEKEDEKEEGGRGSKSKEDDEDSDVDRVIHRKLDYKLEKEEAKRKKSTEKSPIKQRKK